MFGSEKISVVFDWPAGYLELGYSTLFIAMHERLAKKKVITRKMKVLGDLLLGLAQCLSTSKENNADNTRPTSKIQS